MINWNSIARFLVDRQVDPTVATGIKRRLKTALDEEGDFPDEAVAEIIGDEKLTAGFQRDMEIDPFIRIAGWRRELPGPDTL